MVGCCVVGCGKNSSTPTRDARFSEPRNITYHQFPSLDLETRNLWIKAVQDGGRVENWTPGGNTKICSLHFALKDIKINKKGTQIKKGAVPNITKTSKKKPPRRNAKATKKKLDAIVDEAVQEIEHVPESLQEVSILLPKAVDEYEVGLSALDNKECFVIPCDGVLDGIQVLQPVLLNTELPSTSSSGDYLVLGSASALAYPREPEAPQPVEKKKSKKVVKLPADNHTFDPPAGETFSDPCLPMYSELMDLVKKFNTAMSLHHPEKADKVQQLMNIAGSVFNPDETEPKPSEVEELFDFDISDINITEYFDGTLATQTWDQEIEQAIQANVTERDCRDLFDNPDAYLNAKLFD